ncbi:PREDICTED: nuclear pore complex protein Nup88-like, partial [Rhagoletis zephyria]|uniref:nuclear pore complex protein Nup88-like n=1 Tax=Rhagoletis zephyria TaxID=28612 RepID=UPI0008115760
LFDIEDEYEPVETISLARRHPSEQHFNRVSAYTHSLGEGAVAFDFGPSLGRFHALDVLVEALDILPVFVLRGNGDVLLFFLSLKDLSISNYIFGPLKMTPAAEDNYGTDACSILCLNCVPPVVVIGTSTGLLYHCIAIEGDSDEELLQQSDDDQSTVYRPEEDAVYAFSTASGLQVAIPESILYVLESIELSFPLTSAENADESLYNVNALNSSLVLLADGRDPKRYLCQHSFGVHIVLVSFLKQLHSAAASLAIREFHDEKSVVEYLVCTRPTIEKGAVLANKNAASSSSFPVGVTLYAFRGFTHIAVLLNSAELICKRLNNVVLPEAVEGGSGLPVKSTTSDISSLLASPGRHSAGNTAAAGKANSNFPQHLEKILQRNSSLPLIKSSAKTKSAAVGQQELEMLITAIDLLRKEYLEKFSLAAKAIEQRKKALRNICQKQFKDIETLKSEKEQILADYIKLMKKYEQTKDAQSLLSARLDKKIAELQYQRPTLSDAEITLKEEMTAEVENIAAYKAKYEQIKRKQRYQEAQLRKVNDGTAAAAMFNGGDADDAAGGRAESAALMPQLNTIKELLTCQ